MPGDRGGEHWVRATEQHELALVVGEGPAAKARLVCRNNKGAVLRSVPKAAKESDAAEQLRSLRDFLARHEAECAATVERWMLGSIPVPTAVVAGAWDDPAWQRPLRDAVVAAAAPDGALAGEPGFLRAVDPERGLGVVDLDGETAWLRDATVVIPHPIALADLDELRSFALELDIVQSVPQLLREVFVRPDDVDPGASSIDTWSGARFAELRHATGRSTSLGYRVRGGFAVCRALDAGVATEARYWIGSDSPEWETWTGPLLWVDADERPVKLGDVGPVAWSEGARMASLVHAGRATEEETR